MYTASKTIMGNVDMVGAVYANLIARERFPSFPDPVISFA
jgi:hypothetical protein|tara:strand:+ start:108 stop:227 length:120 start_codon:yes stop_codon:yes gene_type:complete